MSELTGASLSKLDSWRGEVRDFLGGLAASNSLLYNRIKNGNAIGIAFAIFHLGDALLLQLSSDDRRTIIEQLERELRCQETRILEIRGAKSNEVEQEAKAGQSGATTGEKRAVVNTDISKLPNSYASAVLVAGYLEAIKHSPTARAASNSAAPAEIDTALRYAIKWLTEQIIEPQGFIPSLYWVSRSQDPKSAVALESGPRPSSYLTFWCAVALCEWQQYVGDRNFADAHTKSLGKLVTWARRRLREMLAFHHGGLQPQFDVVDASYAAATLLLAGEASDDRVEASVDRVLVQHLLSVLFQKYFNSGCLENSAPVFNDITKEPVQVSTAEVLAAIFLAESLGATVRGERAPKSVCANRSLLADHLGFIQDNYIWLRDHGDHEKGWYPEGQGRANEPNSFATACALRVFADYGMLLENELDRKVRLNLAIGPYVPDKDLEGVEFPEELKRLFEETIFRPMEQGKRDIASYSVILYGPPGTSKTTIAKLVARRLQWPLKEFGPGTFLTKGVAAIDQTAAEIFEALRYLKDVVVLFDEVEELVGERDEQTSMESRLLTTAMLPRLQDLRDRKRIVFILATNRVERIDSAIRRLGRFDIVRCVLHPSQKEREKILADLIQKYKLTKEAQTFLTKLKVTEKSEHFTFGDLKAFVLELAVAMNEEKTGEALEVVADRAFEHARKRVNDPEKLEAYKAYRDCQDKVDRPCLRDLAARS